jgi:SOS-response transcriptional repressor LexA
MGWGMEKTTPMPPLTNYEATVLRMIVEAAIKGDPCPSNLDIEMELGCNSTSVAPVVVRRLEEKGYIAVTRYQRAREVTILATGQSTARHPQRKTTRDHVPRGSGSAVGKLAKASRGMAK